MDTAPSSAVARRLPFYYGWLMVASAFMAGMASSGPTLWSFSVFAVPMTDDLGWSRATFFGALTARQLLMGALAPLFGRLADKERWPKPLMVFGGAVFALSLALISTVDSKLEYFLVFAVLGGLGMSAGGGILRQAVVAKWFVRRRGRAMAMSSMGTGMGAFVYPLFAFLLISSFGWRTAWLWMGASSFLLLVPMAFLIRRQPEDIGLLPDGDTPEQAAEWRARAAAGDRRAAVVNEYSYSLKQVARTRTLWFIVIATMLTAPSLQGMTSSWVPYFQDKGLALGTATAALTIYGLFSILSRFVWGYVVERYHVRSVIMVNGLLVAGTILFLLSVTSPSVIMVYAAFQGIILGGFIGLNPLLWPNYFGRGNVGAIRGTFMPFVTLSSAFGPLWVNMIFDSGGSYRPAYWILLTGWLLFVGLMYFARPLKRPGAASDPGLSHGPPAS